MSQNVPSLEKSEMRFLTDCNVLKGPINSSAIISVRKGEIYFKGINCFSILIKIRFFSFFCFKMVLLSQRKIFVSRSLVLDAALYLRNVVHLSGEDI